MRRVCFFSGDITRSGGTERVSTMIANELVEQEEYEVCFLSLCEQNKQPFFLIDKRIKRYTLGKKWIQPGPGYLPLIPKIHKFLKQKDIDVIIDIDIVLDCLTIPARKGLKTKIISWEQFNCLFEMSVFYRKLILKFSAKRSHYVVTLTERDKKDYERMVNRKNKIVAIYNPMEEIEISKDVERKNHIATVGRLVPEKGLRYLTVIAGDVLGKHPDWKWYIIGEGEERAYLEDYIVQNHLENQLILTGLVSDVGMYLKKSKIFVLTSESEGLGMCLLEAKAYDLPCVSFDVPTGPGEVIEEGISGYLVEPFNCREMANKINMLIENEELRNTLAGNAKNNMNKFRMEFIMEKWNKVLDNLCE